MPSPVRVDQHGEPHFDMIGWLGTYTWATLGVRGGDSSSVRLDLKNMPQPDICPFIDPAMEGQARISDDGYLEGAPELIAEIAASSVSYDLSLKFEVYRRNGVREYLVWRVQDRDRLVRPAWEEDTYACRSTVRRVSQQGISRPLAGHGGGPDPGDMAAVQAASSATTQAWPRARRLRREFERTDQSLSRRAFVSLRQSTGQESSHGDGFLVESAPLERATGSAGTSSSGDMSAMPGLGEGRS